MFVEVEENEKEPDYSDYCKVILVGDSGVGKTSIIKRFNYKQYEEDSLTTIRPAFDPKTLKI